MSSQMHWFPLGPDPRLPPAGSWVTVHAWCGCGLHLGKRVVCVPAEALFTAGHVGCPAAPLFTVEWTGPAAPWTPQHP